MRYEILENITAADVAFKAYGTTVNDLFSSSAEALLGILLANPESLTGTVQKKIELRNENLDMLLYDFLNEILFIKDSENIILKLWKISVTGRKSYRLACKMQGEKIDRNKHSFNVDIKSVTMHELKVEKNGKLWEATVVVDV